MAESSLCSGSPNPEISSLKEALRTHQLLLPKLAELEEEREASASAASEALSVILRIQGEKAAVKLEANQYKRIAEEKMCYFEETVDVFEDLICQKELEIAALEYQVQSYRCRLLSISYGDLGLIEKVRTVKSLPPIHLKDSSLKKNSMEMRKSLVKKAAEQESIENYDYFLEQEAIDCDFDHDLSGLSDIQDVYEVQPTIKASQTKDQTKSISEGESWARAEDEKKKKDLLLRKPENGTKRSKEIESVADYIELEQLFQRFEKLEADNYIRRQEISREELKMLKEKSQA